MAGLPGNIIFIWDSTNATIPSGWSRETTLDGLYPKAWGSSVAPNNTGGSSTHTHASSAHSHTLTSHTHTYTTSTISDSSYNTAPGGADTINYTHYHTGTTGASTGGGLSSVTSTYASVSNNPPYYDVIFIKSSAGASLAENICALWGGIGGSTTIPSNWNEVTATRGKFLRGATTGADAGTTGGSSTNIHTLTHTHTVSAHGHGSSTSGVATGYANDEGSQSGTGASSKYHTHAITFNNTTEVLSGDVSLTTTETVEPAYKKLTLIKKAAAGLQVKGLIGLWLGATGAIPAGWVLMDGNNGTTDMRDKYLKIGDSVSEIGNTGGSNTHTHGSQDHTHTSSSHTHTHASISAHNAEAQTFSNGGGVGVTAINKGEHTVTTNGTVAIYSNAATTGDSSSNEPSYRTAAFIQYQKAAAGGMFLLNIL
jgi:hypothetical protein